MPAHHLDYKSRKKVIMDRNPPWGQIKLKYLTGFIDEQGHQVLPTLEQLADEYKLHISTVLRHSADEGWAKARADMQARIVLDAFKQYESEMSATIASIDRRAVMVADRMLRAVEEALDIASDNQERMAVVAKYSSRLLEILNTAHSAYGVDIQLNGRGRGEIGNEQAA
jgi:hypothetical protein